jgi:hypothetical protein
VPAFDADFSAIVSADFNVIFGQVKVRMHRLPRNVEIAFSHGGLTHYGGILFFNEFTRVLQLR